MIKIAITGVHGSGKTTLVNALTTELKEIGYTVERVDEAARTSPMPINDVATLASQQYLWTEHLQRELLAEYHTPDYVVCDRTLMDTIVYYHQMLIANPSMETETFRSLRLITRYRMITYDFVVRRPICIERVLDTDDEVRIHDPDFAFQIDALFDYYLDEYVDSHADTVAKVLAELSEMMR